jgi:hypothetical protein
MRPETLQGLGDHGKEPGPCPESHRWAWSEQGA